MTVTTASVSKQDLTELIDAFPDYQFYGNPTAAREIESPYRMAVGRLLKDWGDRLLDLVEHQKSALNRSQAKAVDTIVDSISQSFRALNTQAKVEFDDRALAPLANCDAEILHLIEEILFYTNSLRHREFSSLWLDRNARPLYRRVRRLQRKLQIRNELLGIRSARSQMDHEGLR